MFVDDKRSEEQKHQPSPNSTTSQSSQIPVYSAKLQIQRFANMLHCKNVLTTVSIACKP